MSCVRVELPERGYPIYIEKGLLARCGTMLPKSVRHWIIVADEQVAALYGGAVQESLCRAGRTGEVVTFPAGESSKCPAVYERLCRRMLQLGLDRGSGIIALGGGVTGDLAGFAAATLLRGVPLVQMPTTLLSQVDSSVGGKTGLNLPEGKNLLGAFYQPQAVLIDPDCLATLPEREIHSGMAEIIKYGMIADDTILSLLEADEAEMTELITRCCRIKADIVAQDERDGGVRRMLNFGHTFGHVYEALGDFSRWTHGEAVAAGMMQMLFWEASHGEAVSELTGRLAQLLKKYDLPREIACPATTARDYLRRDKKCRGGVISAVLVTEAGRAQLRELSPEQLTEGWRI
ncbi:MAG: 3-dehydroquinate synthase [Clostridiales bacterium]|nr:3-dehydroquinate synthase [Candidatus Cacconaster stercorequi]